MDKYSLGGGSVVSVVLRLLVLSLIVGIVLSALGITPYNILNSLNIIARRLYDIGFGTIDWILQYILVGALVVVPVWIVARIMSGLRKPGN